MVGFLQLSTLPDLGDKRPSAAFTQNTLTM